MTVTALPPTLPPHRRHGRAEDEGGAGGGEGALDEWVTRFLSSWQWGALVGLGHRRVCCSAGAGSSIIKPRCHVEMVFLHPQHVAAAALLFAVLCAVCPVLILIYRVLFPTVLRFPWREHNMSRRKDKDTTVVFAGSFNPPHFGHLVMLRYLAERYGRVICCIGVNPNKTYDVTPQARASILRKMCEDCSNIRVQGW